MNFKAFKEINSSPWTEWCDISFAFRHIYVWEKNIPHTAFTF